MSCNSDLMQSLKYGVYTTFSMNLLIFWQGIFWKVRIVVLFFIFLDKAVVNFESKIKPDSSL